MFLFKKIVSQFFFPMPVCLFLCFTGLVLLWWTKKQRSGKVLVTCGLLLLTAFSYEPVSDALLRPLERKYPVYMQGNSPVVKYVVVLGGGHESEASLPVGSQLSDASLKRLVEGICIYRQNPGSKLILSGGKWMDSEPEATLLTDLAKRLGVSPEDILVEPESRDTEEEAKLIAPLVNTNRFVLVTSASHMPRAVDLFRCQGLNPDPAPAEHLVKAHRCAPGCLFPSSRPLRRTETAFYEFMGGAWSWLRHKPCG